MRDFSLRSLPPTLASAAWLALRALAPGATTRRPAAPAPGAADSGPRPIVFYSQVAWDDVWQRPQEMATGFARLGRPTLFVSPVQAHNRHGRLARRWSALRPGPGDTASRLLVSCPLILPGEYRWEAARRLNRRLIAAEILRLLPRLGPAAAAGRFIYLTNSPFSDYLADRLRPEAVVYDIIDDFVAFSWAPPDGARRERRLLETARLVLTGTETLLRKKAANRPEARFIACGVDFERFAAGAALPEPAELRGLPRPILGYMGTLSDRLDRPLLEALAQRFPQASLVFIGPIHGSFGPPLSAPNAHHLGLKPPEALPAYVARFDAALMPFAQTEAARAINPVKTLEYLAAGRPVVSTPIPDVERFFSDVVSVAPAIEPFLDEVERLLRNPSEERRRLGVERARARSWSAMVQEMDLRLRENGM